MLTGRRFVIWGLSRLSVRVARALAAQRAAVTVVLLRGESDGLRAMLWAGVETSVGDLTLLAGRHSVGESVTLAAWRAQGVRVRAWRSKSGPLRPRPPSEITPPFEGDAELILCGPAEAVRGIIR